MKKDKDGVYHEDPIHLWFGLSYCNYFVLPRMAMQSMPLEWQERFIALIDEAAEAGIECPRYHVLRDDPAYTLTTRDDEEDEHSRIIEYSPIQEDEWANYRHPDYTLLPENLRPDKGN